MTRNSSHSSNGESLPFTHTSNEFSIDPLLEQLDCIWAKFRTQRKQLVVWLCGSVGAGKTTLTRAFLRRIGLPTRIPVTSPTFTYVVEYEVGASKVAHADFYRLLEDDDSTDFELFDLHDHDLVLIEWPAGASHPHIPKPDVTIEIEALPQDANQRCYTLTKNR